MINLQLVTTHGAGGVGQKGFLFVFFDRSFETR